MRTLTLRAGSRMAVTADRWHDTFAVVARGRVQLELSDGSPGPVLPRDACFWLRGTGVRALRNPGRRTARIRIATRPNPTINTTRRYEMSSAIIGRAPSRLAGTGIVATLAAVTATTLAAALAGAAGIDFEIPDGGETIPLSGFAVVTAFFSLVGVALAAALARWSARPAARFAGITVALTALSLVPPFLVGAAPATVATLVALHLIPAAVLIPVLTRALRTRAG